VGYELTEKKMRNEVENADDTAPPSAEVLAHYRRIGALESGGAYISFSKTGAWLNQDEENIDGSSWIVEMSTIVAGARKWKDSQIIIADFDLIANGKVVPEREGLGDGDKTKWGLSGDPWQRGFLLRFVGETGDIATWAALTNGARQAVGNLIASWTARCERGRGGWPVVKLDAAGYTHKVYGHVPTPKLLIQGWAGADAPPTAAAIETTRPSAKITSGPAGLARLAKASPTVVEANLRDFAPLDDDVTF
jgi:hypothetical protein